MKLEVSTAQVQNAVALLRKAGYSYFVDPNTGKPSYIIRLTSERYPRFHLYLEEDGNLITFDLHLDQKAASYSGTSMHAGEYDGPAVEREMERIKGWIAAETGAPPSPVVKEKPKDESQNAELFGGIFS